MTPRQMSLRALALAFWLAAGCAAPVSTARGGQAARGQVTLPSGRVLRVEVADTPEKRARGYMFRDRVADDEGMIFLMESLGFHPFWMKNCKVSLDIIWLDENWRAVHLEQRVPPCKADPCPGYAPLQAGLYVLEVQGGLAARERLKLGDRITYTSPRSSDRR